ncbi:anthrax toxin lethal factor-related metalloendopeptidase [Neobacillus sp. LXY-1]|uniref:anthrax toxin lethal factor-related metalloendopeptidase n=1 Tax=Neobacillus sp. LXY-1 TaxID=3379133 RepID=UPI003EE2B08B
MRKWFGLFIITCSFLFFISTSQASYDGILLGDFSRNSVLYQSITPNYSRSLNDIIVLPRQHFNQREAANIINRINELPPSLLQDIDNKGITLKLFTGKLTDNPTASALSGQIPRGYQTKTTWDDVPGVGGSEVVLVKIGCSEQGKGHGSINLELHELAHSIDHYVYDDTSQKQEFHDIWEKEHDQLFPGNSYFNYQEEYFAETFAMYYLNKDSKNELKIKAPNTYKFFENIL